MSKENITSFALARADWNMDRRDVQRWLDREEAGVFVAGDRDVKPTRCKACGEDVLRSGVDSDGLLDFTFPDHFRFVEGSDVSPATDDSYQPCAGSGLLPWFVARMPQQRRRDAAWLLVDANLVLANARTAVETIERIANGVDLDAWEPDNLRSNLRSIVLLGATVRHGVEEIL
jgi:hypothetical protein